MVALQQPCIWPASAHDGLSRRGRRRRRRASRVAATGGSPDRADADVLLRLLEILLSDPVRKARNFWRTVPDGLTFAELREMYPHGTGGFEHIDTLMTFWETTGSLLKHGLLSEELAFDSFLEAPPWKKVEVTAGHISWGTGCQRVHGAAGPAR